MVKAIAIAFSTEVAPYNAERSPNWMSPLVVARNQSNPVS